MSPHQNTTPVPYNTRITYTLNEPIQFSDFSLTFLGIHDITEDNGITLSLQTTDFKISPPNESEQILKIGNGQLPNEPRSFRVKNQSFTLWSGESPNADHILIDAIIVTKD